MSKPKVSWWNEGDGGEWFEPYVTNGDVVICFVIGLIFGCLIALFL